ncbi:hypothetical protein ACH5RR_009714 [Cinchona calisaya]|uniref:HSF-type DNA-binding domain-containing protein n=1 Tax=Cinchona calisaya TaxID=153742 RepID=A0ABD3AHH4_9GENT
MEEFGGGIVGNSGIIRPSSLCSKEVSEKTESVKGVRGFAPPPFLTKTFKMVEDPETNTMISWNSSGTSIIILDHLKFAAEILPKYFRHSNFSSFIYQLNNYGFKKIGLRQYEYENQRFQAGQEHLLKNIKRRNDENPTSRKKLGLQKHLCAGGRGEMEADMENVEESINSLKVEIAKLKCQQGDFQNRIATFEKDVENKESKSKELMMFLSRIFSPSLVEKAIQLVEEEQDPENHETAKRRRLLAPQSSENDTPTQGDNGKNQDDGSSSPIRDQEANTSIKEANEAKQNDEKMWKMFMEDDSVSENESEQKLAKLDMAFDDDLMVSKIVNAKEPNMDVEDEVTLELWT